MARPLNRETLGFFSQRLGRIAPQDRPRWGNLDPATLMSHLRRAMEIATGEYQLGDLNIRPVPRGLRWLVIRVLPWPRRIKAPTEFTPPPGSDLDGERQTTLAALTRFVEALERDPERVVASPVFGRLTLREWSYVNGKHLEHHLRQFRV